MDVVSALAALAELVSEIMAGVSRQQKNYSAQIARAQAELKKLREAADEYDAADQSELDAEVPPSDDVDAEASTDLGIDADGEG